MLIGPVFTREVVTVPRRLRLYVSRTVYVLALFGLMGTAWLILAGTQDLRNLGDLARFGSILFQFLAMLQMVLAVLFSALLAASAVAQEKDRRTLVLLLLTNLSDRELVLGKLLASLLGVLVMLAAALPLFMLTSLLGGVAFDQIARVFAVTLAATLAAGSLGSTLALWRETTFQTLAFTALAIVFWVAAWEIVAAIEPGGTWLLVSGELLAACFSPTQVIWEATRPLVRPEPELGPLRSPVYAFMIVSLSVAVVLNLIAIWKVRHWNPSRGIQRRGEAERTESIWGAGRDVQQGQGSERRPASRAAAAKNPPPSTISQAAGRSVHSAPGKTRQVWDNPILWREVRTWAYGRKILFIRLGYVALAAAAAVMLHEIVIRDTSALMASRSIIPAAAKPLLPLFVLSLVLLNALAVTSVTTERDGRALDLLLVTDLSPKEIVFGKLGGIFYNSKEMILLPMLLCGYLWWSGGITLENLIYVLAGLLVMSAFCAMLGIHVGMAYGNSRSAVGASLGTVLFLFIGIATCMRMMIAFNSFPGQFMPFVGFIVGGGLALFVTLGWRNPSRAIATASFLAPAATFYAITGFLLNSPLAVALVTTGTYGFATAAMLIPALSEFDVATGRTTVDET